MLELLFGRALTGKHSAGSINNHHAHATMLIGTESLPKFQGPGRNLSRPLQSFKKIGVVKDVYWAMAPIKCKQRLITI